MNKSISPKITALTFGVLVISFLVAFYVVAWQEPTQAPPGGNVATPLNVGSGAQTKEGDLTINGVLKTLQNMIVNLVTIKGDGSISANLNSDKVDSYHAADLLAAGGGGGCYTHWGATTCASGYTTMYTGTVQHYWVSFSSSGGLSLTGPVCTSVSTMTGCTAVKGYNLEPCSNGYYGYIGSGSCAVCCK